MKMLAGIMLVAAAALVFGAFAIREPKVIQVPSPLVMTGRTSAAEVSDLIQRLKPLAKDPDREYGGIDIRFFGSRVHIKLETKDGNQYHGSAKTLKEAVARITDPSSTIREALRGWDEGR